MFVPLQLFLIFKAFFAVSLFCVLGYTAGVADSIMGLTFVAFGVSMPDVISSLIVVRQGIIVLMRSNSCRLFSFCLASHLGSTLKEKYLQQCTSTHNTTYFRRFHNWEHFVDSLTASWTTKLSEKECLCSYRRPQSQREAIVYMTELVPRKCTVYLDLFIRCPNYINWTGIRFSYVGRCLCMVKATFSQLKLLLRNLSVHLTGLTSFVLETIYQGPVVQSIVSLTSSLRGQLVKCFTAS